jgi:hypothetical protein
LLTAPYSHFIHLQQKTDINNPQTKIILIKYINRTQAIKATTAIAVEDVPKLSNALF